MTRSRSLLLVAQEKKCQHLTLTSPIEATKTMKEKSHMSETASAGNSKPVRPWFKKKRFIIPIAIIAILTFFISVGSANAGKYSTAKESAVAENSGTQTEASPTPTPEAPKPKMWTAGTYLVGTEIAPGVYRTDNYWSVNAADGTIIDNDLIMSGTTIAVIPEGAATVKFSGNAMAIADSPTYDPIAKGFTEGTYVVGKDIQPGQYRISGKQPYAARLDANLQIIDNDLAEGSVILMIDPSDAYFRYSGTIEKIG